MDGVRKFAYIEWACDLLWALNICVNFVTLKKKSDTFMHVSKRYLKLWFWIDALSTFPAIFTLQGNQVAQIMKMLRFSHLKSIFLPLRYLLNHVLMRNCTTKHVDNTFTLLLVVISTVLFAHVFACMWIYISLWQHDGFMKEFIAINYDGVWESYGAYELNTVSMYFILTVLSTVGYGDFYPRSSKERIFTMFLEVGGMIFFSSMIKLTVGLA